MIWGRPIVGRFHNFCYVVNRKIYLLGFTRHECANSHGKRTAPSLSLSRARHNLHSGSSGVAESLQGTCHGTRTDF